MGSFDTSNSTRNRQYIEQAKPVTLTEARMQLETVRRMGHELDTLTNGFNADVLARALAEVCRLRQQEEAGGVSTVTTRFDAATDPFAL